jgi:hypothetical protein
MRVGGRGVRARGGWREEEAKEEGGGSGGRWLDGAALDN